MVSLLFALTVTQEHILLIQEQHLVQTVLVDKYLKTKELLHVHHVQLVNIGYQHLAVAYVTLVPTPPVQGPPHVPPVLQAHILQIMNLQDALIVILDTPVDLQQLVAQHAMRENLQKILGHLVVILAL